MSQSKDRRAKVEQIRKEQAARKRRTLLAVGACAVAGVGIIAAATVPLLTGEDAKDARPTEQIGVSAADAGCLDPITKPATGGSDHRPQGEEIAYPDAPPAFGPHYDVPVAMERKFYTSDRPPVETLVHNLEHGFTILWYDETIAEDAAALAEVKELTRNFPDTTGLDDKFLAVPWTSEDGEPFPDGTHVALTHWSLGNANGETDQQVGVWRYCEKVSGEVVDEFIADYPFTDAPEGNVPGENGIVVQ